jgi:hypothetical protein
MHTLKSGVGTVSAYTAGRSVLTSEYLPNHFEAVAIGLVLICFHLVSSRKTKTTLAGFGSAVGTGKNASIDLILSFIETKEQSELVSLRLNICKSNIL